MTYADAPAAVCTLHNGEKQTLAHADLETIAALEPVFVDLHLPLPALGKLSLTELVVSEDPSEQRRAVHWAGKRTDIVLWCTQACTAAEAELWAMLPEHVLDHSFVLLTHADTLRRSGSLEAVLAHTQDRAQEYFPQTLAIGTRDALAARQADGKVDKDQMRASGGMALISAVLKKIEMGKRAAQDSADLFLSQVGYQSATAVQPVAPASTAPAAKAAADAQAPDPKATAKPEAKATEAEDQPLSADARALCEQAAQQLMAEGTALQEQFEAGTLDDQSVLEVSVDTVTWLADYLENSACANDPGMRRTCRAATDAADLVQLIQLETAQTVAQDALGLMIQLKQEILAELAA